MGKGGILDWKAECHQQRHQENRALGGFGRASALPKWGVQTIQKDYLKRGRIGWGGSWLTNLLVGRYGHLATRRGRMQINMKTLRNNIQKKFLVHGSK